MSRLIGEVDIPNVPLTMNKSDFDRDGAAWIAVEDRMHRVLAPWTRRLARDGGAPPPASALKVAEQVRRLLSQALRLADRPELFSGDLGSLGPAPAKGIGESELPLELPAKEKRSEPRPPREREPRPRGFGRIVIRPLDPSVRSQLVVEEGVTVVVINSPPGWSAMRMMR